MQTLNLTTEILVVGGGASGVCAAIQAARLGAKVVLIEETPWLGGMLTAAGVSAIDGNHHLPSGLWGEFRQKLYDHYGGPEAVATGWVSNTQFEPHVGAEILQNLVANEPNISVYHGFWLQRSLTEGQRVTGAVFTDADGAVLTITAVISIDATEYGDFAAASGCTYSLGRESHAQTGETGTPEAADDLIQDLTYVAILKDYGADADHTLPEPPDYHPEAYACTCKELCADPKFEVVDCQTMLNYGRLPNDKFMINWPINGNDYYLNLIEMNRDQRRQALTAAKNFTLGWIYHIQTRTGHRHLGLADDEFPTADRLALIPYIRESRRIKGLVRLTTQMLKNPYHPDPRGLYRTGIAVGDYPLDHHHKKAPQPVQETFPGIPAFNVPYGCLVPQDLGGLLVAEKSISVSHMVNGCTRLQPVVMQIGQAAGASAALCVQKKLQPDAIPIRELQEILLKAGCWLMPFQDVSPSDWAFAAIQRIGLAGVLQGVLISKDWANEMRFYPDRGVGLNEATRALNLAVGMNPDAAADNLDQNNNITRAEAVNLIWANLELPKPGLLLPCFTDIPHRHPAFKAICYFYEQGWLKWITRPLFRPDVEITRREFAYLIDVALAPFHKFIPKTDLK